MSRRVVLCALATLWPLAGGSLARADTALWLEAAVSAELHDRVELEVAQHLRFDEDVSRVAAVMPEVGVEVDVAEYLALGAGYRYEYERRGDELEGGHRVNLDGELSRDIRRVRLGYRLRLQEDVSTGERRRVRNRLDAEWRRKGRLRPFASGELFHDADDELVLDKSRWTLGVEVETWERNLQTYYRIDVPRDGRDPLVHIIGLEVKAEL